MLGGYLKLAFADVDVVALDKSDVDVTDLEALRERLVSEAPQHVINAAAYTDVDGAESDREAAFVVNETGVRNVAKVASEIKATVVHYSTDYVFPGTEEDGYQEGDRPGPPVNKYGESKLAGEVALREETGAFYLIRTAWLYGQGGNNFVNTMLKLAEDHKELTVVNDQHGSPTFARDLAAATRKLINDDYDHGVYHLTGDGVTTWFDFAQEIFRQAGLNVKVSPVTSDEYQRAAKRPEYSVLKNVEGPPMRRWQEALFEYISEIV